MGEKKWGNATVRDKVIWLNDLSKIELWPLFTDNICKTLQCTWLRKTVWNTKEKNERLQPQRSFLMLMINFILMHHTVSEQVELAFKSLFTICFQTEKLSWVIQWTNYQTIKNNDRISIQFSIIKTSQK